MGKYIGQIYKHSQSQLSTSSLKALVHSYLASLTSSSSEITTTSVPSVRDKKQNNSVLGSPNTINNNVSTTNNNKIQSCEIAGNKYYSISTTSTPNHHAQCIAITSAIMLNLQTTTGLPPVGK